MPKSVFISLFIMFCGILNAQNYKLLKGRISHPNLVVAGIHVINADRGLAEITDIDGNFEISVAIGEELIFSGVQYKKRALIISPEIFALDEVTVYLEAFINELDEVVVKPHNLSGSLSSDLSNVKGQINFDDVGIPGYKGVRKEKIVSGKSLILSTLLLPISGGINIDAVYKHLSGYYKKLKKRRKLDAQFEMVFSGFGSELPAFTQMVVNASEFMQAWWLIIVGVLAGFYFAYKQAHKKSQAFRDGQERLSLKMPVVGDILNKSCIARFARTLSTTFAAGVPLVDALDSAAGASGNVVYKNAIMKIKNEVSGGTQLNHAMNQANVFPSMVIQMVAIGEESGALDSMLEKSATYYEEMVDTAVDGLTSLIEPVIMAFLGVVVGGMMIAMYLPIFKMGGAISG